MSILLLHYLFAEKKDDKKTLNVYIVVLWDNSVK